jgi:large subunit ribosomal protein L24
MSRRIQRGDTVVVLAGAENGRTGKVLRVDPKKSRVYVEGLNMQYKHMRRSQENPKGGRVRREGPIHLSNVAIWSEGKGEAQRVRMEERDGRRVRVGAKDGSVLDQ